MPSCISYFMQFLFLLSVYLASSLLSKYDVVVIPNSILGAKRKQTDRYCAYRLTCIITLLLPAMIYGAYLLLFFTCFMNVQIQMVVLVLFFLANSLVNPIIYALRMPGFREGLLQLVYGVPDLTRIAPANLPLRNL